MRACMCVGRWGHCVSGDLAVVLRPWEVLATSSVRAEVSQWLLPWYYGTGVWEGRRGRGRLYPWTVTAKAQAHVHVYSRSCDQLSVVDREERD